MYFFRLSLTVQMAIATLLGILVGVFFGDLCQVFQPWANAYVMILKVTILPYLVGAIIHGLGGLSTSHAKQIVKKGVLFIILAWGINLSVIYLVNFCFATGPIGARTGFLSTEAPSINFADILIPENIFLSLVNNTVPAVVVFSVLVGVAFMRLKNKEMMMSSLATLVDALTQVTSWISRITPIGTFLIMAQQVGTIQLSTFKQVATYLILYILAACLVTFWIFPRIISTLTRVSALRWVKLLSPILLLAYTTNVVIVALPYIMEAVRRETEELYPRDEKVQSPIQGIVSVVFNLPLASLFIVVFVLFSALFYQIPLNFASHVQLVLTSFLTGLGAVGLGSWVNSLNFLLDSLNMPQDAINLYLTTLPFVAGFQSMVSATEIASLSLLITLACRQLITWKWARVAQGAGLALVPVLLLFIGIKILNPLPPIERTTTTICALNIQPNVKVTLYQAGEPLSFAPRDLEQEILPQILESKTLRVGYNTNVPPFCFVNSEQNVVGYDIAFACELASDLGCALELVPIDYANLEGDLNRGIYDVAMSAISITSERLKTLCFPTSYMQSKLVLVFSRKSKKLYTSQTSIAEDSKVKIAVLKGSSYTKIAETLFPEKQIIFLNSYEEFAEHYSSDVLLWEEQEAISWVLRHPEFYVFFPKPSLGIDSLSYPIKAEEERLLCYLNQWLLLKENQGFTEKMYNLWILGKKEEAAEMPPRWSILRDVLHWEK